jgi:circadian clock protein KaiC
LVRQVQVLKMRGNAPQPGLHTVRMSAHGVEAFPRMIRPIEEAQGSVSRELISTGIAGLDEMMGGGTLRGNAMLIAGPAGCGKTTMAVQFLAEGVARHEPGVLVMFEETTPKYLDQAKSLGFDLEAMARDGLLEIVYLRPLDLSMDETLYAIQAAVDKAGGRRVVVDSLTGLEAALAPAFTGAGVTILLTVEIIEPYHEMRFTPHPISFLNHDIVLQRYYEIDGELRTLLTVVKSRARSHSRALRDYEVTAHGIVVGAPLDQLTGIITAVPQRRPEAPPDPRHQTDRQVMSDGDRE